MDNHVSYFKYSNTQKCFAYKKWYFCLKIGGLGPQVEICTKQIGLARRIQFKYKN